MNRLTTLVMALLISSTILAACSGPSVRQEFPSFVYRSAPSLEGYRAAVESPHVLRAMPCYCGCGESPGHRNLYECFVDSTGAFDEHASGCDLCNREALDAVRWFEEGRSVTQVRTMIEDKYSEYGTPTDTPYLP